MRRIAGGIAFALVVLAGWHFAGAQEAAQEFKGKIA